MVSHSITKSMFRLLADFEIALKFHLSQSNAKNHWKKKSRGVPMYLNIFFERKTALTSGSLDDKNLKNKHIIHNCKFRHVSKPDIEAKCPNISTIQCISKPNIQIWNLIFSHYQYNPHRLLWEVPGV